MELTELKKKIKEKYYDKYLKINNLLIYGVYI